MLDGVRADDDIVYASCTQNGDAVLRHLLSEDVPICEIVSLTEEQADANAVSGYAAFDDIADEHDIPIYYPERYEMRNETDRSHFQQVDGDILIVNGWQRLVPEAILKTFTRGALGVHGSAYGLPKGRGRSPLNWSVIEGVDRFLHSVIKLSPGADDGDIVATKKFEITDHDDIRTLYYKNAMATMEILDESLGEILRGDFEFTPQEGEATYYPKRTPEDGAIHWGDRTGAIYDLVRAVARPYPGAFTEYDGRQVMIWEAIPFSGDFQFDAPPGEIVQVFEYTDDFVVKTADGTLLVEEWECPDDSFSPEAGLRFTSLGTPDRVDEAGEHA